MTAPQKPRGKPFVKGQVANPRGRPPGVPDRRTRYRELIEARMPELIERCVCLALQGDVQALRLCLERVLPAVRPGDETVVLPEGAGEGLGARAAAVVGAAMSGQLSLGAADALIGILGGQARVLEFEDLLRRIEALEAAAAASRSIAT